MSASRTSTPTAIIPVRAFTTQLTRTITFDYNSNFNVKRQFGRSWYQRRLSNSVRIFQNIFVTNGSRWKQFRYRCHSDKQTKSNSIPVSRSELHILIIYINSYLSHILLFQIHSVISIYIQISSTHFPNNNIQTFLLFHVCACLNVRGNMPWRRNCDCSGGIRQAPANSMTILLGP